MDVEVLFFTGYMQRTTFKICLKSCLVVVQYTRLEGRDLQVL